ncbi:hypothetical protein H4582DRAFT_1774009, partial [Lactarius indigo]
KCCVWKINEEGIADFQAVTKFHAQSVPHASRLEDCDRDLAACSSDAAAEIWSSSRKNEFGLERVLQRH